MKSGTVWMLLGGAGLAAWLLSQSNTGAGVVDDVTNTFQSGVDAVQAAVSGWANVQQGPVWVPVLNAAEQQYGIPPNLLARMAYQESSFRQEYIDGTKPSSAGALGILQLMPNYFASVRVPIPFSAAATAAQIQEAAQLLVSLYQRFADWGLAVGAYNDGAGNMASYVAGTRALPQQTLNYVSQVLADVPVPGATIPV